MHSESTTAAPRARHLRVRDCSRGALALALIAAGAMLACGSDEIAARWAPATIHVDGALDEWAGAMQTVHGADARVGAMNDGEALYLAFGTDDPGLARIVARTGLTVWIDPRGGMQKELGVVFPQPAYADGPPGSAPDMGTPGGARVDTIELLGPAPYTRKEVQAPGENGLQVAVGGGAGASSAGSTVITYELRVPLAAVPWGLGVKPGDTIGVGVSTNRMGPWTAGRPRRDEGGGPGDRGPGGGRGRGMGRGGGGGYGGSTGEWHGLQAWTRVHLATGPH